MCKDNGNHSDWYPDIFLNTQYTVTPVVHQMCINQESIRLVETEHNYNLEQFMEENKFNFFVKNIPHCICYLVNVVVAKCIPKLW